MNDIKLILVYSYRLLVRQWARFVLPTASLIITAVVLMLMLLLTSGSALLLSNQSEELNGGDVVIESASPFSSDELWQTAGLVPDAESKLAEFSGTLESTTRTAPFTFEVVDINFPLYGSFTIDSGEYIYPETNELYLDKNGADKLSVQVGDTVSFGEATYLVKGIVVSEPTILFSGFRFLPRVYISTEGFAAAAVDPTLLRIEYQAAARFDEPLTDSEKESLRLIEEESNRALDVDIAGEGRNGLQSGLQIVSDFLTVAVLITAVLAAVNIYASTLYFLDVERKSLAILLAIGLSRKKLLAVIATTLGYVVLVGGVIGTAIGYGLFAFLQEYVAANFTIVLPTPSFYLYAVLCLSLLTIVTAASFVPAIRKTLVLNPRQILIGGESSEASMTIETLSIVTLSTITPLIFLASFLLGSVRDGLVAMLGIAVVYIGIAVLFFLSLRFLYARRHRFSFFFRSIISEKRADGLFGIVSFTSLFVGLTAISTLTLTQLSLERYLAEDLARTVPTTYVVDVQPSQKDQLLAEYTDLTLFSNVPARIIAIDDTYIQDELAKEESTVDRELGREFNLTARTELLESETVVAGEWGTNKGEISVDEEFADRAGISIGSRLIFSIQGFTVEGTVTSLRSTDSRSGLPFFYFVLSPEDLEPFPSVHFGYSFYDTERQQSLGQFLAATMPNVSMIETQTLGPLLREIIETLLLLVFVVTVPPLLIATMLISTLVVSSYAKRRHEGARLRALGATKAYVFRLYIFETMSLTVLAALFAYGTSVLVTTGLNAYFFSITTTAFVDTALFIGFGLIIAVVSGLGLFLFVRDTMPLRSLLAYENT